MISIILRFMKLRKTGFRVLRCVWESIPLLKQTLPVFGSVRKKHAQVEDLSYLKQYIKWNSNKLYLYCFR